MDNVHFSHNTDSWSTPKLIYNYYMTRGYFDPCPLNDNYNVDALKIKWDKRVFCNPPYSKTSQFIEKGIYEIMIGNTDVIVFLIPARTETKYFKRLFMYGCVFEFIEGRLKFNDGVGCAPFPSMFIYLSRCKIRSRLSYLDKETYNYRFQQLCMSLL